jgi:hypothetical protein
VLFDVGQNIEEMKSVAIGFVLFTIVFGVSLIGICLREMPFLFSPYSIVTGEIVKTEPENHASVYYTYSVGDQQYQGVDSGGDGPVGTSLAIYYSINEPWFSRIEKPKGILGIAGDTFLGALFIATAGTIILKATGQLASIERFLALTKEAQQAAPRNR